MTMKTNRRNFLKLMGASSMGLAASAHANILETSYHQKESPVIGSGSHHGVTTRIDGEVSKALLEDNGKALINPGMGWVTYYYSNLFQNYGSKLEPSDTAAYFPGMNTVFFRIPWSFVEPREGVFVWELIDTPAQRWISRGGKVGICITATENWMESGTPKWVFDAGAACYEVDGYLEPEYDDPIFLEKVDNFVRAFAAKYDANPDVEYVFVGHYGMWGEGHTELTTPKHGLSWGFDTQKRIIDIYCHHFKNTLLCISDDYVGHNVRGDRFPITDYAFSRGVSIHDDSILVQPVPNHWYHSEMAQLFWPTLPVVLEHEHYGGSVQRGAWNEELLLQAVEDYHASYLSIHWWPDVFYEANKEIISRINRRIGYRLNLSEITWPTTIQKGEPFTIQCKVSNVGVAPCYRGGHLCFTLKDEKGGLVAVLMDTSFDVKELAVMLAGQPAMKQVASTFTIAPMYSDTKGNFSRTCLPGTYELFVSVGRKDGTPIYELPYSVDDGQRRYKIGMITLGDYAP